MTTKKGSRHFASAKMTSHYSFFKQGKASRNSKKKIEQTMRELGIDNMKPDDYIPSEHDNPSLVSVKVVDLLRNFNGRGVFAETNIKEGETIGTYTGTVYSSETAYEAYLKESDSDNSYAMKIKKNIIDAKFKGNFTRFINYSDMQDNVAFFEKTIGKNNVVDVIATRNVQAGEQLLIDYNTHEERFISEFFFLNPNDSWLSASEVYNAQVGEYQLVTMNIDLPVFKIKKGDLFYVTHLGVEILKHYGGEAITKHQDKEMLLNEDDDDVIVQGSNLIIIDDEEDDMDDDDELNYHESLSSLFCLQGSQTASIDHNKQVLVPEIIDLPFIKLDEDTKTILDFSQADSFTALMYACYWGQIENVKWLINAGANVNQQQNHSGMSPLFFALQGYNEGLVALDRYLDIISFLVASGVNTASYDRTEQSFLHKAIELLGNDSFQTLIHHLKEKIDFNKILDFLDANDMDPILFCFKQKNFERAEILLNCYPDYFEETFIQENEESDTEENEDIVAFSKIIKTYTSEDKKRLLQLFKQFSADTSTNLIDILGLQEDSSSNLVQSHKF